MQPHDAVVTLWFVNAKNPAAVLRQEPKADRGFGRKYLALLNPQWPIAVFGQFPLNRSASVSSGEFYIAGYPGITVIQTLIPELTELSQLDPKLLRSVAAADVYAFAENVDTGFGGIAHWHEGKLRRSFCARKDRIYEDQGLPEVFENPFWSGERRHDTISTSIDLPFDPLDLAREAPRHWLGVDVSADGPDLNVVGYAIDGRKEPRISAGPRQRTVRDVVVSASNKLGIHAYDDYEAAPDPTPDQNVGSKALSTARDLLKEARKRTSSTLNVMQDKLRHTDRG